MFLYPQTKGELERELASMHFGDLTILRPNLLKGRPDDGRFFEKLANKIFPPGKPLILVSTRFHYEEHSPSLLLLFDL